MPVLGAEELALADIQTRIANLSPQQRQALDALQEALRQHEAANMLNGRHVTSLRIWRNAFRTRFPPNTGAEAIYKGLQRAKATLFKAGLIELQGERVWLKDDDRIVEDGSLASLPTEPTGPLL